MLTVSASLPFSLSECDLLQNNEETSQEGQRIGVSTRENSEKREREGSIQPASAPIPSHGTELVIFSMDSMYPTRMRLDFTGDCV